MPNALAVLATLVLFAYMLWRAHRAPRCDGAVPLIGYAHTRTGSFIPVRISVPPGASRLERDAAALAALAEVEEADYLMVGDSKAQLNDAAGGALHQKRVPV